MKPERWQRIERIYHAALERDGDERAVFLAEACADDATLRSDVEMLLAANEQAGGFMVAPALELEARNIAAEKPAASRGIQVGQDLSHYKILSAIGAGGMGEVFLAQDKILERRVALKLLPVQFTQNAERLQRFIREAKAASALNHPNIITIYEIGQVTTVEGETHFIATEFIEGVTLRAWTVDEEKRLRKTLDIAIQIASALDAAHKAGIVHRDIKPENVMVRPDGLVKVLDFGLAKLTFQRAGQVETDARTMVEGLKTMPGIILGTLRYMSPEQARGRDVDARSDIFSLGVVLYELLTLEPLFAGETSADVIAAIIHKQAPPLTEHLAEVPVELERIVQKALAKEADARFQSAEDVRDALRTVRAALPDTDSPPSAPAPFKTASSRAGIVTVLSGILQRSRMLKLAALTTVFAASVLLAAMLWLRDMPHQPRPESLYWYDVGIRSLRNNAYYEASKALEQAVQKDDKFALAHARLAEAWSELDYFDRANRETLRARQLVPELSSLPRLEALYLQSITSLVLRDFGPAIESFEEITRQAPDAEKSHAYLDLGRAYEKNEQIEKAVESYTQATRLAPSDPAAFLRLGILYGRQQNLERASATFQQAEARYQALSNYEGVTEVFYQRGFLFKNLNKLPEARGQLEKALEKTKGTENQYQQIKALQVLSSVCVVEGNTQEAENLANRAIKLARDNRVENQVTHGLIWLGNIFLSRGDLDTAEKHYKDALALAQRDNDRLNEAWAFFSLGSLRAQQRNTDEAIRYIEQALPFYQQRGDRKWLSRVLTLFGRVQRDKGDYAAALQRFKDSLQMAEEGGDLSVVALSHGDIGDLLANQEQYPEALSHYDEVWKINKVLNAALYIGYSQMSRGSVLWQTGRYAEAKAALDESSDVAAGDKYLLASIYLIETRMELSLRHFQEAKAKGRQAVDLAASEKYMDIAIQAKCALGLAEARSGAARAGTILCNEAVEMAAKTGDPQLLSSALLAQAEAMMENNESQRALETALRAQESFARFGQMDSEWRAWLVAARAAQRMGDKTKSREYAGNAEARLSSLGQKWGSESYNGYLARPDVKNFRGQLNQALNPQR